jgi:tetratricopeptide (TPR) repeat protein
LIEAIWQYCQAEQWQEAYDLIKKENIFNDVNRWGGNAILLELFLMLLPSGKWHPEPLGEADIYISLGKACKALGRMKQAREFYEQALSIYKQLGNRKWEGSTLNNLGSVSNALGKTEEALRYHNEALDIRKEVGDRRGEGTTLHNIGTLYFNQDCYDVAFAFFLLARGILEEVLSPDREDEQNWIDDLRRKVGEKRFTQLLARVEPQAHQIVEQALHQDIPHV